MAYGDHLRYELVKETEEAPWTELHILVDRNPIEREIFEIDEPIHLVGINVGGDPNVVWRITEFKENYGLASVGVHHKRSGSKIFVPIKEIEKLSAMLRIAIEASD